MSGSGAGDQRRLLEQALRQLRDTRARLSAAERARTEPVAVLGIGVRTPGGAADTAGLWELLCAGTDTVTAMVDTADGRRAAAPAGPPADGRYAALLPELDGFDAEFFGIGTAEADHMDPQQRLVLETAWEAAEDAGLPVERLRERSTGVFLGLYGGDYLTMQMAGRAPITAYTAPGGAHSIAANRVSYLLDLTGPSLAVDTACSSSLIALHLACRALRAGDCDFALVGGVNVILTEAASQVTEKVLPMAPGGRCRTFDAGAEGIVRAEGCGMLLLTRLSDAEEAGHRVRGVIRGTAVNHNGRTNGLTAPAPQAQTRLIRRALLDAGARAQDVVYVEAHGTGTRLGDPIEVDALREVYGPGGGACAIGSVKTNFGHQEAAAGISGLIKALLVLEHGQVPPHLHLDALNPEIDLSGTRLTVPTELTDLPTPRPATEPADLTDPADADPAEGPPRLAAVSSFGFGGANAHAILAGPPPGAVAATGQRGGANTQATHVTQPKASTSAAGRTAGPSASDGHVAQGVTPSPSTLQTDADMRETPGASSAGDVASTRTADSPPFAAVDPSHSGGSSAVTSAAATGQPVGAKTQATHTSPPTSSTSSPAVDAAHTGASAAVASSLPDVDASASSAPVLVLPLSARSGGALDALAQGYADLLESGADPAAVCSAAAHSRTHHPLRLAVTGVDAAELAAGLRGAVGGRPRPAAEGPRVAFVFSGQGTQWLGMGREFADRPGLFPAAHAELVACDAVVRELAGWSVVEALHAPEAETRLAETGVAQVAIGALQLALAAQWRAWGVVPDAVAGHSMGEVVAACAAGMLTREQALDLLVRRARHTERGARGGRMAALAADADTVGALLAEAGGVVGFGAVNGPRSTVVSGEAEAVARVVALAAERGVTSRALAVEYAFHSALLDGHAEALADEVRALRAAPGHTPLYSTVTGERIGAAELDAAHWARNLREAVLFHPAAAALARDGYTVVLEVGPHPALLQDIGATFEASGVPHEAVPSLRRGRAAGAELAAALGGLYRAGVPVDWTAVLGRPAGHVALPLYPWQRRRHWLDVAPESHGHRATGLVRSVPESDEIEHASAEPRPTPESCTRFVRERLAAAMGLAAPEEVAEDAPLEGLDLDSLIIVELKNQISRELGFTVPLAALLDSGTVAGLGAAVAAAAAEADGGPPPHPQPEPTEPGRRREAAA
ncbi:type I polyketide synthase [Yinghuangia seranimata]|uniref:type I polyketide synthase n=1 Tax=Yinghuangia seranimata TaxID=408067 RepID=UPI00248C20EB|nr:beta-ketoacyl synthase N-terminal-like domain-containing protein [Yinghuangia seranimata]MDI2127658.1 beta-ketoacyl synthase N-terminal-like domain-containing protein [Yinghuangia seranimata]